MYNKRMRLYRVSFMSYMCGMCGWKTKLNVKAIV